jgi:hypothetical protein
MIYRDRNMHPVLPATLQLNHHSTIEQGFPRFCNLYFSTTVELHDTNKDTRYQNLAANQRQSQNSKSRSACDISAHRSQNPTHERIVTNASDKHTQADHVAARNFLPIVRKRIDSGKLLAKTMYTAHPMMVVSRDAATTAPTATQLNTRTQRPYRVFSRHIQYAK